MWKRDTLKLVNLNKSQGLDGLPNEVNLRLSHMFVPILRNVLNHWFTQGTLPGNINKRVITQVKKSNNHSRGALNTKLKILAQILANHLCIVTGDFNGPEQNYTVKRRSIQNNRHLMRLPKGWSSWVDR